MDDGGIGTEVLLILVLLVANGVFAMSEMAVVSARKTRLQQRADEGDTGARRALELAEHPNRFLSTVQVGITLIGILAGAYGGATIAEQLARSLEQFPTLAPYSQAVALALVVGSITYLSLVIGELVPKRIALTHPERIASLIAAPMHLLSVAATPLVKVLSLSTDGLLRVLGVGKSDEPAVTEGDVTALIDQGAEAGVFGEHEQDLFRRIFALTDQHVGALMTPRRKMVWLDLNDPPERNREKMKKHRHSRFPVCEGGIDHIVGIVDVRELWANERVGETLNLRDHLLKPHAVAETMPPLQLLELFRETGIHFALVVDEYGGVRGLVTLNDVLEEITGNLTSSETLFRRRDDGSWLIDGSVAMTQFWDALDMEDRRSEERADYHTLAGFVLTSLGHVPREGEWFKAFDLRLEVVDMDGHRVDKVLVSKIDDAAGTTDVSNGNR